MHMPLTVFDCKGIPATRRERIEAAVEAGDKHLAESYEGWIAADPLRGGVRVLITGPQGFERSVTFATDEDPCSRKGFAELSRVGQSRRSPEGEVRRWLRCVRIMLHFV